MFRLFGGGVRKERLVEAVPFGRGVNLSVLGAFDLEGMVATTSKLGAMKRVDFEQFLQSDLLPRLLPGSVLVLDNARIHHGGSIEQIVSGAGCSLLYLPPYSPDFSPIELAWSWIKEEEIIAARANLNARMSAAADARTAPARAGIAVGLIHELAPAAEIVRSLVAQAERILRERPSSLLHETGRKPVNCR